MNCWCLCSFRLGLVVKIQQIALSLRMFQKVAMSCQSFLINYHCHICDRKCNRCQQKIEPCCHIQGQINGYLFKLASFFYSGLQLSSVLSLFFLNEAQQHIDNVNRSSTNIIGMREAFFLLFLAVFTKCCQPFCNDCSNSFCTACADTYQLTIDAQCVSSSMLACALYDTNNNCLQCQPTFHLINSTCQKQYGGCIQKAIDSTCSICAPGMTLINSTCEGVLNCDEGGSECTRCLEGFSLRNGTCFDESAGCMIADPSTGVCVMCNIGFQLIGYACHNQSNSRPNCLIYNQFAECIVCKAGYLLNLGHRCVIPGNNVCKDFDENSNCLACAIPLLKIVNGSCIDLHCKVGAPGNCQVCENGYEMKNGPACRKIDPNCLNSTRDSLDRCQNCIQGFFVNVNGTCSVLPANCFAANIVSLTCIECNNGFTLGSSGLCRAQIRINNCIQVNQASGTCSLCNAGYYISGNTCAKASSLCDGFDQSSGLCLACKNGYLNAGGQCFDPNCAKNQGDNCVECKQNFKPDSLSGLCRFADPNCASLAFLGCNACKAGYYLNPIICVAFPPFCSQLGNDYSCSQCKSGFSLVSGQCVVPIQNCMAYTYNNSLSICAVCVSGYRLSSSQCIFDQTAFDSITRDPNCATYSNNICLGCANRYYFSKGVCTPVNPNCKNSSADGNCTDCYSGYAVLNGNCVLAKDSNCKTYSSDTCSICYSGYFLSSSKTCQAISPLCKLSNATTGACLQCFTGYSLVRNTCIAVSNDPNCINFNLNGQCVACSSRFIMKNGLCTPINPLCKTYNTTTGNCITCYPGYYLANGACIVGSDPTLDINCKLKDNSGRCLQCYSNYFLANNSACMLANPLCKTINLTNGACLTCYPGYTISSSNCVVSTGQNSDPNCISSSNNVCSQCYTGFYVVSGVCTRINVQCKTYNSSNGWCLSCYPGYVTSNGQCIIPQSFSQAVQDPYCMQYRGSSCSSCSTGYFPLSGICQPVNPLCKSFDSSSGNCLSCYPGYVIQGANCVVIQEVSIAFCQIISNGVCLRCMQGYYTQTPMQCAPVSILCSTYDQNTGNCLSCISGYFLQVGQCVFPSMGFDANCMAYDVSAYCSSCKPGFYLLNYICAKIDPFCVSFNVQLQACSSCGGGKTPTGARCQ